MKFEILKSEEGKLYFNIVTRECLIMLTSRHYEQKSYAIKSMISMIEDFVVNMSEHTLNNLEVEDLIVDRTQEEV